MNSLFIPSEKLGVLESHLRVYCSEQLKGVRRKRLGEFAGLLKKLGLLPREASVAAIGLGCDMAGQHGALVLVGTPTVVDPASPGGRSGATQ